MFLNLIPPAALVNKPQMPAAVLTDPVIMTIELCNEWQLARHILLILALSSKVLEIQGNENSITSPISKILVHYEKTNLDCVLNILLVLIIGKLPNLKAHKNQPKYVDHAKST